MSQLTKRVWFYGTWCRVILSGMFALGFVSLFALVSLLQFWQGRVLAGFCFLALFVGMLLVLVQRGLKFRADVRAGMRAELKRQHCCPRCEYDLRASVERCPECGYVILKTIEI